MYSAASITCTPAAGSSSGQAIEAMGSLIKNQLGGEFGYEWTSVAYQETQAGNTTTIILIMALLVAYLVLAAQYESWTSPVAAVMGLPVAILGAMLGCWVMGVPVSIYTQIGIILLMSGKSDKKKITGEILLGFVVLMYGMSAMSGAVEPLSLIHI